jgi:glycine/D-amino acid oxidase-like deaminating enzyme
VQGRCDVTREDIAAAGDVSVQMLTVLTDTKRPALEEVKDLRSRAGEYLCRGAETIRRAAGFIYYEDPDSMERYPSLWRSRGKARRRASAEAPEVVEAPEVSAV